MLLEQRESSRANSTTTILWQKQKITNQALASVPVNIVEDDLTTWVNILIDAKIVDVWAGRCNIQIKGDCITNVGSVWRSGDLCNVR